MNNFMVRFKNARGENCVALHKNKELAESFCGGLAWFTDSWKLYERDDGSGKHNFPEGAETEVYHGGRWVLIDKCDKVFLRMP